MISYDIIVIGLGPAGMAVSAMAGEMGLHVCSIEKYRIGGECMNVGCIPSKALLKLAHTKKNLTTNHVSQKNETFKVPETFTQFLSRHGIYSKVNIQEGGKIFEGIQETLSYIHQKKTKNIVAKADIIYGQATFVDPYTIKVNEEYIQAKKIFIATGTKPAIPPIPGLADIPYLTNETIFSLDKIPEHLFVIGGGAIGCEMTQAFARLGSNVTIAHVDEHLLPQGHSSLGNFLQNHFRKEGIVVLNKAEIQKVQKVENATGYNIFVNDTCIYADTILVAAGRKPALQDLQLENAGVKYDKKGIIVNTYLQTSQKHIYAIGDCNGKFLFSHAAMHQGMIALMNSLLPGFFKIDFTKYAVPWVVFTDPQVAFVGNIPQSKDVICIETSYEDYGAALAEGVGQGWVKARVSTMGKIYAAAIAGENAGEMINERALAIQKNLRITDIMMTQHAFPTMGFLNKRIAEIRMMKHMPKFTKVLQWWKKLFW